MESLQSTAEGEDVEEGNKERKNEGYGRQEEERGKRYFDWWAF